MSVTTNCMLTVRIMMRRCETCWACGLPELDCVATSLSLKSNAVPPPMGWGPELPVRPATPSDEVTVNLGSIESAAGAGTGSGLGASAAAIGGAGAIGDGTALNDEKASAEDSRVNAPSSSDAEPHAITLNAATIASANMNVVIFICRIIVQSPRVYKVVLAVPHVDSAASIIQTITPSNLFHLHGKVCPVSRKCQRSGPLSYSQHSLTFDIL